MGGSLGKLRAVAVWLVTPATAAGFEHDAEAEQRLRQIGVSEEEISAARQVERDAQAAEAKQTTVDLWAWHADAAALFDAMKSQWRVAAGMGGLIYLGLDYGPRRDVMESIGLAHRHADKELFEQFRVMERAAAAEMNRKASEAFARG